MSVLYKTLDDPAAVQGTDRVPSCVIHFTLLVFDPNNGSEKKIIKDIFHVQVVKVSSLGRF